MCGIAGVLCLGGNTDSDLLLVKEIIADQHPRGPDANAIEIIPFGSHTVTLGHNRLSIIDLSGSANQPMWDANRTICLVFNGEIYNYIELRNELKLLGHEFRTSSDSEVLLASYQQWGIECVSRFLGMFAFAIWDSVRREIWLARDRFGVKPLYYHCTGDRLVFASTPTKIARHFSLKPDLDYALSGIEGKVYERDSATSPYLGLLSLEAGCTLRASCGSTTDIPTIVTRYYDLALRAASLRQQMQGRTDDDLIEESRDLLASAVRLRLRSDVPVGISLSGGLDSSTIAGLAAAEYPSITAFSFSDPSDKNSEGPLVQEISAHCHLKTVFCSPSVPELCEGLIDAIGNQGAPFQTASVIGQHFVFKTARQHGITVLLGGQGADEALMGYHKYKIFLLQHSWRERRLLATASNALGLSAMLLSEFRNMADYWSERRRFSAQRQSESSPIFAHPIGNPVHQGLHADQPPWKRQVHDICRFSLPTLLRYEDRNSMGNSIESRLPFMDHRFIEFGVALPDAMKVRHGLGKWILRQWTKELIPRSVSSTRRKRGFDVAQNRWMLDGMGAFIRSHLSDVQGRFRQYLTRPIDIDTHFSDQRLVHVKSAFAEAVTLLWLGRD